MKPLGYYGVNTSLPEVKDLETTYGSNLQSMTKNERLNMINTLSGDILDKKGIPSQIGKEQSEALIKAIAEEL